MSNSTGWRRIWEDKSATNVPDFELDRGISPRDQEIETLAEDELVTFTDPQYSETLLDAGCGTGVNILRLHSRVKNIIGIDYALGSVLRCHNQVRGHHLKNVDVCVASVTAIPLPDNRVDRVVCLSVLQYLDDDEVRAVLREFVRVLVPGGVIILHVKNASSLYWLTLGVVKRIKASLGLGKRCEYVRPFRWYVNELALLKCRVLHYNSFNLLVIEGMPKSVRCFLQKIEFRYRSAHVFRASVGSSARRRAKD